VERYPHERDADKGRLSSFSIGTVRPGTAGRTLASFGAASVVPVTAALAGAQRHCSTASSAEADAGKERRATNYPWCGHRRTAALEQHSLSTADAAHVS
jgi:hypothetical protein